jgi:hypothetical protein
MLRTAAQIVEQSLRLIGIVSPYEEASDSSMINIGLDWFDMMKNNMIGTSGYKFFQPEDQSFSIQADIAEYDLNTLLDTDIQFITEASLYRDGRFVAKLPMLTRGQFAEYKDGQSYPEQRSIYITTGMTPKLTLIPAITEDGFSIKIHGQTFSKDVVRTGGKVSHDFSESWELYLVYRLAAHLGGGVILTLPIDRLNDIRAESSRLYGNLISYRSNDDQRNTPRRTTFAGY